MRFKGDVNTMQVKNQIAFFFSILFWTLVIGIGSIEAYGQTASRELLKEYLLPADHPLHAKLEILFTDPDLFSSPTYMRESGFKLKDRPRNKSLMVARHFLLPKYLLKKHQSYISPSDQLKNYLKRIRGARALEAFIELNHLKYIVVPKKWLYELPEIYSDPITKEKSYILIVEDMDICGGGKKRHGETAQKYYNIDLAMLRELCFVLYYFRGLDSMLHNLPFTHSNQIAFIDTERWEKKRENFMSHILTFLRKDCQEYALTMYQELCETAPREKRHQKH